MENPKSLPKMSLIIEEALFIREINPLHNVKDKYGSKKIQIVKIIKIIGRSESLRKI